MNRIGQKSRFGVLILLLLALALRGAIPAGFMPEQGGHGLMRLAICTGSGHETILVDAAKYSPPVHGGQDSGHKKPAPAETCPFAPVLAQDVPLHDAVIVPAIAYAEVTHSVLAVLSLESSSLKPWFAQGPPVS